MKEGKISRSRRVVWILAALLALIAAAWLFLRIQANRQFESRPLVLIQSPIGRDEISSGEAVLLQATARSQAGLSSMLIWIDDQLVAKRELSNEITASNLTLTSSWVARNSGQHLMVVEAISANGVRGQASIAFTSVEAPGDNDLFIVEAGDSLASIADEVGSSAAELTEANPQLGGGEPEAGDDVYIPAEEESDVEPAPERP